MKTSLGKMPFGRYVNKDIEDIPSDYLHWLLEQEWFLEKYESLAKNVETELDFRTTWNKHFYSEREG